MDSAIPISHEMRTFRL